MTKILIVDDNPLMRRLLSLTLGKSYNLFEAEDGLAALEIIRREHPQVVLLDIMMPGEIDGLQVLEIIKACPELEGTRVAMVSACGQSEDLKFARDRRADAYFTKPFSPRTVRNWVLEQLH